MSGLYVHIPFCKSRCTYCDFFSTTCTRKAEEYINAVIEEMRCRCADITDNISTIYIGGGTPSLLPLSLHERLRQALTAYFSVEESAELTIEANPDDLTPQYTCGLYDLGFNRLSIGIQSFKDDTLRLIGRRHNSAQAIQAVNNAREAGFDNISLDLIYGLPEETVADWQCNLQQAIALHPEHISAYLLTYEEGTRIAAMRDSGAIVEADEEQSIQLYASLCEQLYKAGYEHYEVSNFALHDRRSRHNSSYWQGTHYIGLGAAAHSYDGLTRRWNIADVDAYIHSSGNSYEQETLTDTDKYNEYILTRLRTNQGVALNKIKSAPHPLQEWVRSGLAVLENGRLRLTDEGLFCADALIKHLFIV